MSEERSKALSGLLGSIAQDLDIPPELRSSVVKEYGYLAEWLKRDVESRFQSDAAVYPQGSMRLGTATRPVKASQDIDIDLVYRRDISHLSVTQEALFTTAKEQMERYLVYRSNVGLSVPELEAGRRCLTLAWKGRFHLDILPAVPDDPAQIGHDNRAMDPLLITDKELRLWQHTDPKGFAVWFDGRQMVILTEKRLAAARAAHVEVEDVPVESVATPLRQSVQLLKRHRDIFFQGDDSLKPASIIICTLAALAYSEESSTAAALQSIVPRMRQHIKRIDGRYWVANPVNPEENFADRWNEAPDRREAFDTWLVRAEEHVHSLSSAGDLNVVTRELSTAYGGDLSSRAVERFGDRMFKTREAGNLKMASHTGVLGTAGATVVPSHTFYGQVSQEKEP